MSCTARWGSECGRPFGGKSSWDVQSASVGELTDKRSSRLFSRGKYNATLTIDTQHQLQLAFVGSITTVDVDEKRQRIDNGIRSI